MPRRKHRNKSKKPKNSDQSQQPEAVATEGNANVDEDVPELGEEMDVRIDPNSPNTRSQTGGTSLAVPSHSSPHAPGSNTGGQQHAVGLEAITLQTEFLNSIPVGNYLKRTGFIDKKWMFARRHFNENTDQKLIYLRFNPVYYREANNCWVKVGAVVRPLLVQNEVMYQEIIDSKIYGCFLYTYVINIKHGIAEGPLHYIRMTRPNREGTNRGLINGVYPYYTGQYYRTFVEFSLSDEIRDVQPRFRKDECESGISELTIKYAIEQLEFHARHYIIPESKKHLADAHYSAIYVTKYASLIVFFTNKRVKIEQRVNDGKLYKNLSKSNNEEDKATLRELIALKDREGFHERFLIQGGGLVSIVGYPLYIQSMDDKEPDRLFEFKQLQNIKCNFSAFIGMKNTLRGKFYPLIELNTVSDPKHKPKTMMSHFAGYFLEIQNYGSEGERAILQLPTNGWFNAYELGAKHPNDRNIKGIEHMKKQWNEEKVYEDFTGPVKINPKDRSRYPKTYPEYRKNIGSKSEAFPNSKDEYLGP